MGQNAEVWQENSALVTYYISGGRCVLSVRTNMSHRSLKFKIVPRPDWVRRKVAGSKYNGAIDAALKLKDDRKVVSVPSIGMKFNSLSIALRTRIANRKLHNTIHVEQNKQIKEMLIVKGRSLFKQLGADAQKARGTKQKEQANKPNNE